jgi:hypothetical protein
MTRFSTVEACILLCWSRSLLLANVLAAINLLLPFYLLNSNLLPINIPIVHFFNGLLNLLHRFILLKMRLSPYNECKLLFEENIPNNSILPEYILMILNLSYLKFLLSHFSWNSPNKDFELVVFVGRILPS